jgi:hypothetical protein
MIAGPAAVAISTAAVMRPAMARIYARVRTYGENIASGEVDITVKLPVGDFRPHDGVIAMFTHCVMEVVEAVAIREHCYGITRVSDTQS